MRFEVLINSVIKVLLTVFDTLKRELKQELLKRGSYYFYLHFSQLENNVLKLNSLLPYVVTSCDRFQTYFLY